MSQLNTFNGGLSTRLSPYLIGLNESVICENVDTEKGNLGPLREDLLYALIAGPYFYFFNDSKIASEEDRDYVEFQSRLYYTDGVKPKKSTDGMTFYNLGIEKPSSAPTLVNQSTSEEVEAYPVYNTKHEIQLIPSTTGGDFPSGINSYLIKLSDSITGLYVTKYISVYTEGPTASIDFSLTEYLGIVDRVDVYRLHGDTYRFVDTLSSPALTFSDTTYDISANLEMPEYYDFTSSASYTIVMTNTTTGFKYIKKLTINFGDSLQDWLGVKFYPLSGYTYDVYRSGYKVNLVSSGGFYYDIGDLSDIKLETSRPDGTYQYCYTYYNSEDGAESQPSEYSEELEVEGNSIRVAVQSSVDPQVTNIRLYRIGGNLTAMSRVTELDNITTTYTDDFGDLEIDATVLESYSNGVPPSNLKGLIVSNAMLFGFAEDKIYYSDIAFPNSWSAFNFIDFDSDVTGIGETQNGLLVFTRTKTYIVTGNSPATLSKYLLDGNQGCLSHKTIQYTNNTLLWLSTDGICASEGGNVQVISKDKLGKLSLTPVSSAVYDEVYYLSHATGTILADFRFGLIFKTLTSTYENIAVFDDILYGANSGNLYKIGQGSQIKEFRWKSSKIADGAVSMLKNYKDIYVYCEANLNIKVYIDNEKVIDKGLDAGFNNLKIPQSKRLGYYIQFEVSGYGELHEIEYKMELRQNGK